MAYFKAGLLLSPGDKADQRNDY